MKVFLNGHIVPIEDASVSVLDHGFLYGDGIFETMRAYDNKIFKLDEHLKRLEKSAGFIELKIPHTNKELKKYIYNTIEANNLRDATVRLTITRGPGPTGLNIKECNTPTVFIYAQPFTPYPAKYYTEGASVIVSTVRRNLKEALNPEIKSLNFLNNILAKNEATKKKAVEAIMLNSEGFITECSVSNIFFVNKENILCTPSVGCGILDGITRQFVIEIARENGFDVFEGEFTTKDIYGANEVFLTNTVMEILPVGSIDSVTYQRGHLTEKLSRLYMEKVQKFFAP